ncbi:uracil-DNA glycosylase, partial [Thermodesulfobacteriota bacterium]
MNSESDLKELVVNIKKILAANLDTGIEFPPLNISEAEPSTNKTRKPTDTLENLKEYIGDCTRCKLSQKRKHVVFGEGASNARLMFIGEGPGRDEDLEGRPFIGEAGKLLTRIIENGMGIKREEVYICNVVKCRPPVNRDPEREEIDCCISFLKKQIEIIKPEAICTLGRIAARELLKRDFKITLERGRWQTYLNIPVMPTYHP